MQTLPLSAVKARLSELVNSASTTRDEVEITINGRPAAMIVGYDEWQELQETLYWLSTPEVAKDVEAARAEVAAGGGVSEDEIRARFGVPRR